MGLKDRIEDKLNRIFSSDLELTRPVKIIYTEIVSGGDIAHPFIKKELILKKNKELINGFFLMPTNDIGDLVTNYDGELLINDLDFDITSVAFSKGVYTDSIIGTDLTINSNVLDLSSIENIDDFIDLVSSLDNMFCFKLSDTEFAIISSVADGENDSNFKNLEISGTAKDLLGLDSVSKKATLKIQINNVVYSVKSVFNGDYIKSVKLIRG
jgi:acyl carrier protein